MKILQEPCGQSIVLHLKGPLSVGRGVRLLRSAARRALARGGRGLVIDLAGVGYLDAAGIGALVTCHRRALRCGQRVVLTGVRGHVHELLGLTRVSTLLPRSATALEAAQMLEAQQARRDLHPSRAAPLSA